MISLYATGTTSPAILSNTINVTENMILTIAVIGTLSTLQFLAIPDYNENKTIYMNEAEIRFIHLSPNAPGVDITLPNGTIIFENISFKERTMYKTVAANKYTLQVRVAGTSTVVLTVPDIVLESKTVHTIYAIGLIDESPELEALILLDGFFI